MAYERIRVRFAYLFRPSANHVLPEVLPALIGIPRPRARVEIRGC